jgi:hypothetical protein
MIPCSRNDVVLLPIPFSDLTSTKVRPAIFRNPSPNPHRPLINQLETHSIVTSVGTQASASTRHPLPATRYPFPT